MVNLSGNDHWEWTFFQTHSNKKRNKIKHLEGWIGSFEWRMFEWQIFQNLSVYI